MAERRHAALQDRCAHPHVGLLLLLLLFEVVAHGEMRPRTGGHTRPSSGWGAGSPSAWGSADLTHRLPRCPRRLACSERVQARLPERLFVHDINARAATG
jgi:hypothetical protein